jgi:hypothetical protein
MVKKTKSEAESPHQRNERLTASWTRRVGQLTCVMAIIAALTAWILWRTDETSRIANRAYVFISDVRLAPVNDGGKLMWAVIPVWENGGNTSTRDLKTYINFAGILEKDLPAFFSRCDFENSSPIPGMVLGPKQASTASYMEKPPEVFSQFQNHGMKKLYLWGYAKYREQFSNEERITRFCFDVQRIVGKPEDGASALKILYAMCRAGNCADDQCYAEDKALLPVDNKTCKLEFIPNLPAKEPSVAP